MKLYFIRHGATSGNRERRYVGRTNEGILEEEKERLRQKREDFPVMDGVFVSPYLRCRQTAEILFGKTGTIIIEDFREMDFGEFEYKNYQELSGNLNYQKFIDSGGTIGFPGGEEPEQFKCRCRAAFQKCVRTAWENRWEYVGLVVHGGTIMAILEAFACPPKEYYEYQTGNGCGFVCRVKDGGLREASAETVCREDKRFGEDLAETVCKKDKRFGETSKETVSGSGIQLLECDEKYIKLMIEEDII